MGFWSGFEGLTGHQPGAFKGFSLKDILDKDMWERTQRIRQQPGWSDASGLYEKVGEPLFDERTGEKMMTNWYKGRGRPELMNPRVGAAGVSSGEHPRMGVGRDRPFPITPRQQPAQDQMFPYVPTPRARAENLLTPSWAGSAASADRDVGMGANRFLQLGNPRNIRSGPDLPPASMVDKTIVKKTFADPAISDTVTETIKEKVPTGSAQWGNSRHPPNWLQRMDEGYFGRPRSEQAANWQPDAGAKAKPMWGLQDWFNDLQIRKLGEGVGEQWGNLWDASVLRKGPGAWDAIKAQLDEARRKRYEEAMRARGGY